MQSESKTKTDRTGGNETVRATERKSKQERKGKGQESEAERISETAAQEDSKRHRKRSASIEKRLRRERDKP
jgi:hypothetical protein